METTPDCRQYNRNDQKEGITFEFGNHQKLLLIYTYRCPITCQHCIIKAGPLHREKLSVSETEEILKLARTFDKRFVTFSGGEFLLYWEEALRLIEFARSRGYRTSVDTNCFWAVSYETTQEKLQELVEAGLDDIFPSVSAFHQKYLPVSNALHVLKAAQHLRVNYEINFYPSADKEMDEQIIQLMNLNEEGYFCDGLSTYGRDVEPHLVRYQPKKIHQFEDNSSFSLAISPEHEVVFNNDITPGNQIFQGTSLVLGNMRQEPLEGILKREFTDPLIYWLGELSPEEFVNILLEAPSLKEVLNRFQERLFYTYTEAVCALLKQADLKERIRFQLSQISKESGT